ncbi:MAG TPA: hypothetical protein VE083_02385 [Terriglobales bacterium]|nr:hypothetical protein [Terriglobales bacterium]
MRSILSVLISLGILLLFAAPLVAKSKASIVPVDQDYVWALATADHFLHAWQTQDQETGILMLTDRLKHKTAEAALQSFFSSAADTGQSFEIGRGKRLGYGRYEFPVVLFQKSSGNAYQRAHPRTSALVVVKAGRGDWAVDKLP